MLIWQSNDSSCFYMRTIYNIFLTTFLLLISLPQCGFAAYKGRKLIGLVGVTGYISPSRDLKVTTLEDLEKYVDAINNVCGDLPIDVVILPPVIDKIKQYAGLVDGLLLGGAMYKPDVEFDIQDRILGDENDNSRIREYLEYLHTMETDKANPTNSIDYQENYFDLELVKKFTRYRQPILGIDSGMHIMALAKGCEVGFIAKRSNSVISHGGRDTFMRHDLDITAGSRLKKITQRDTIGDVVSSHNKSVSSVPKGMLVSAKSPDGIIEAIEGVTGSYYIGVQWHPEYDYKNVISYSLIRSFCEAVDKQG